MRYGTYTTFDAPTQKEDEALKFLQTEFAKINGKVCRIMNPHDFGVYPSFEIDYPSNLENVDPDSEADTELAIMKDEWHEKANDIEVKYNKKFNDFL